MPIGRKQGDLYIPWWVVEGQESEFLACSPYVRSIWMWKEMVRRCHEYFHTTEVACSRRVLTVKYEDLMRDPLVYGKAVVEHLGGEITPTLRKRLVGAHVRSIGAYKRRDPAEVKEAERIAAAELAMCGYA
jgi:hypothetical protein